MAGNDFSATAKISDFQLNKSGKRNMERKKLLDNFTIIFITSSLSWRINGIFVTIDHSGFPDFFFFENLQCGNLKHNIIYFFFEKCEILIHFTTISEEWSWSHNTKVVI